MPPLLVFFRLGCWFLSQPRLRIWTLLVASPLFYAWGAPLLLPLILFLAAIKSWLGQNSAQRWPLAAGLILNIGLLAFFKIAVKFINCNEIVN